MATETLVPDGDGTCQWDSTGAAHYTEIDEGVSGFDNSDYVDTATFDETEEYAFKPSPSNLRMATGFIVSTAQKITHYAETAVLKIEYSIDDGASYTTAGYITPTAYDTEESQIMDAVTGLRFGQKSVGKFRIRVTFLEVEP